eukprot:381361-Rhodomonas_salina.1
MPKDASRCWRSGADRLGGVLRRSQEPIKAKAVYQQVADLHHCCCGCDLASRTCAPASCEAWDTEGCAHAGSSCGWIQRTRGPCASMAACSRMWTTTPRSAQLHTRRRSNATSTRVDEVGELVGGVQGAEALFSRALEIDPQSCVALCKYVASARQHGVRSHKSGSSGSGGQGATFSVQKSSV